MFLFFLVKLHHSTTTALQMPPKRTLFSILLAIGLKQQGNEISIRNKNKTSSCVNVNQFLVIAKTLFLVKVCILHELVHLKCELPGTTLDKIRLKRLLVHPYPYMPTHESITSNSTPNANNNTTKPSSPPLQIKVVDALKDFEPVWVPLEYTSSTPNLPQQL